MFLTIPEHHNRKLEPLYSKKIERGCECDDIYDRRQSMKRREGGVKEKEDKKEKKKGEKEEEEKKENRIG